MPNDMPPNQSTFPNSGSASQVSPLEQPLENKKTTTIMTAKPALAHLNKIQDTLNQAQTGMKQRQMSPVQPIPHHSTPVISLLAQRGLPTDFTSRANLAKQYGMPDYYGSQAENMKLLQILQSQPMPQPQQPQNG